MFERLDALDKQLFLFLNSKHDAFFDFVMFWASNQYVWIPLYIFLFLVIYRGFRQQAWYFLFWVTVMEAASDQLASDLIKNLVRRPRPSHEPSLLPYIHLSPAGPGGEYGFVSSHASNTFALTVFLVLTLPPSFGRLKWTVLCWAACVSFSRVYNGVHYPGDVICGALLGAMVGVGAARLFHICRPTFGRLLQNRRRKQDTPM